MNHFAVLLVGLLPASRAKHACLRRLGWQLARSARVGPCLIVRVDRVSLGERCWIGPLNVLRDLRALEMGDGAILGSWNWVTAARALRVGRADMEATFLLMPESAVTSRHYIDASGGVTVGQRATVAGVRTTIITHSIDIALSRQSTAPVAVGQFSVVSGNVKLVPGAVVPEYSVIAMGSVVTRNLHEPYGLYAGAPARWRKALDETSAYFRRERGPVENPRSCD